MSSILIKVTGEIQEVSPLNGTDFSLEELQKMVGGDIDICRAQEDGKILVVNDLGVVDNLGVNRKATELLHKNYDGNMGLGLCGDVLYCDSSLVK